MEENKALITILTKEQFDELYTGFEKQLNVQNFEQLEYAYKVKTILGNCQLQYITMKNEGDKTSE